jgi:hypothetical protein
MSEIKVNSTGEVKLFDSDNSNYVSIKSPATVSSNQTFVLPDADGSANNALKTDGSGNLGFVDVTSLVAQGIDWQSSIKTSNFTAVSGEGYFCNTSGGAFTATLPASPSAGAIVAFKDYAPSFASYSLTIGRNGSNIQGNSNDAGLSTNRASVVMVYIDSTKGWLFVQESNVGDLQAATYISATGGTITTSGDYKIHTFNSSGTFTVSSVGNTAGGGAGVSYVVLAGGAGGGSRNPGGGGAGAGAGGYREGKNSGDPYSASPLNAPAGLTVSASPGSYPITVGAGGTPNSSPGKHQGGDGSQSVFSTITSAGGGGGGASCSTNSPGNGRPGGSGGGSSYAPGATLPAGTGNTPPVSPPQGNPGGQGRSGGTVSSGGGGGASAAGASADGSSGGAGGNGVASSITGSPVTRGGGGGGSSETTPEGAGGSGGGGQGKFVNDPTAGMNGTDNLGGGGGGGYCSAGGTGGSGVVIIRYKYQN